MKIAESWLREWVDPDLDSDALGHQLTMLGLEVDGVEPEGAGLDGVVVVSHDAHLSPALTRDRNGAWLEARGPALRTLTLAQIKSYDVGRIKPGSRYQNRFPDQQAVDLTESGVILAPLPQELALVASVPLTDDEPWEPLAPGELVALKQGVVWARIPASCAQEGVADARQAGKRGM